MNKTLKRVSALILAALIMAILASFVISENAYAAVKLSNKSLIIGKGAKFSLKVKGTTKKAKWSSTKKSIAAVSSKGVVTGKKIGSCYIKAKVAGKTLKCKVTVKKAAVANAMNLRKYILANGKKAKDGGYYLRKKWDDYDTVYDSVIKAYKDKTEMYFESVADYDSGDSVNRFKMTIDLIKQKPGEVYCRESELDSDYACEYYGNVEYSFDNKARTGLTATKVVYWEINEDGEWEGTNYTDAATLTSDTTIKGFCNCITDGFKNADYTFAKYKLKSRMSKLGFSKFS